MKMAYLFNNVQLLYPDALARAQVGTVQYSRL